jgi:tetratricopeptide (TPR) repeat protein
MFRKALHRAVYPNTLLLILFVIYSQADAAIYQQSSADRIEQAKKEYQQKVKEAQEVQDTFNLARLHYNQGVEYMKTNSFRLAMSEFEQAVLVDPKKHPAFSELFYRANANLAEANYHLGVDLFNSRLQTEARSYFEVAVAAIVKALDVAAYEQDVNKSDLLVYCHILLKNAKLLAQYYELANLDTVIKWIEYAATLDSDKEKWANNKSEIYSLLTARQTPKPSSKSDPETTKAKTNPGKEVEVKGYYRKDGIYVKPHTRSKPTKKN